MAGTRQFNEQEMLDKALKLFWAKGYSDTTMKDIAEETGVQRGSLYNAYGDKDVIFLRVFSLYRAKYVEQMLATLQAPTLRGALESFFDFAINSMTTGTPTRGCLSTKTIVGTEAPDEAIKAQVKALLDDIETALSERISRADEQDNLALDPIATAQLIVTLTRGLVVIERTYQDKQRLQNVAHSLLSTLFKAE
ncbi:MAG: TetR/AcrR family transcriptional regulator [Ewingella americana]|jgi:AcrR family transcriptional regulator|uniref:TetR/AcrR family transcriptional regulator n=1 Tax=Ewingella americana TaxID=41202 RepID=UPI00243195F0|nr:TetR/AcrR family transcriptional regulator [Ewingella americana]MCI1679786.1 TetR/AcrR family transcriptional regulator [Ewingella americana]MCI1855470.1 TetR/AcrR family transcriptional regulator [Ewingella americana]MCI1863036.1 TetR/AcrR family transcriptional regulator [Ewingella americana]MCI2140710.1 TetR/AcrR family transcriptional regulator [Ewingella americana]MCI2164819.1 TetR/AcrR family transcriptional regulator [Ewingella americana]